MPDAAPATDPDAPPPERLAASLALLDHTGRLAQVGGWEIDLESGRVTWTDETCRMHGRPPGWQPSVEQGITHWAPEARDTVRAEVARLSRHGGRCNFELPMDTADGRRIWARVVGEAQLRDGRPVRLVGAIQDVTARREADQALRESREQLRRLVDETPALMASVDREGRILSASDRLLALLDLDRASITAAGVETLLAGRAADPAVARRRVAELFDAGSEIRDRPLRLRHRDGHDVPTRVSAVLMRDAEGRPTRLLAVFDDVSESLRRRQELARERRLRSSLQRQAGELRRLADERREMLDLLAHEVRQPLNNASAALQSAASLAVARHDAEGVTRVARAMDVIGHVVAQIDNTLAAAALLVGSGSRAAAERVDTDIDTFVRLVLADLPAPARERVRFERHTPTRTAAMDPGLTRLALRNLLVNALTHTPAGSPVRLVLADSDEPLALLFDIEDTGAGIEPALASRLFDRGVRGRTSRGQGLGLYIARRALEHQGGTVVLLGSTPGRTVFRIVLAQGGG